MAMGDIVLRIVTKGADLAKKQLDGVGGSGNKSAKGLAKLSKFAKMAGVAVAVVLAKGLKEAVEAFVEFDDKMVQSLAIMDTTVKQQKMMEDQAMAVSRTTRIGASQSAEAYFFLASAGLDAEQSVAALPQVAKFAQAGMFDMATATDLATDAQSALGLTVDNASDNLNNLTRVTDVLVKGNQLANASVQQFSEALTTKAGAALKVVNKDVEEGVAVLAAFADRGVKGAEAGDKLNQVLRDIPRATAKNGEEFAKLGLNMFDTEGNMKNVADIVEELDRVLGPMSDELKASTLDQLGLNRGVADAVKILSGAGDQIREYEKQLRDAGGATDEVATKQMESLKAQTDLMKNAFTELGIAVGSLVSEPLTKLVKWITNTTQKASDLVNGFREWKDEIKDTSDEINDSIYGVETATNSYSKYSSAVHKAKTEVEDNRSATEKAIDAQKGLEHANRMVAPSYANVTDEAIALAQANRETKDSTEELSEEEEKLAQQRESEGLPALNKVLSAYRKIQDIQENIADLEKEERKALEKLNKEKALLTDANEDVIRAEEELQRQKDLSKIVTLEEELAIIKANEALAEAQEELDGSRLAQIEYELAVQKVEDAIKKSTSATNEEISALKDKERAEDEVVKQTESLKKAQLDYQDAQEELAKATEKSTENLMEMAIAKMELDQAIADVESLGAFEIALAQMVANAGGDLETLRKSFQAIFNMTGKSVDLGSGVDLSTGDGSVKFEETGDPEVEAQREASGKDGAKTFILNTRVESGFLTEVAVSEAVFTAVEKAKQLGLEFQ